MKKYLLVIITLILSLNFAYATNLEWGDLELYEQYTLTQPLEFPGLTTIQSGEKFEMQDAFGGEAGLIYLEMHLLNCQNPDLVTEIEIIKPELEHDRSIGVQLDTGCNLGIWVEGKDYYSQSFFKIPE